MDIATDTVVRLGFQQGFRLFLHMSAIHPGQRGHVELEKDVFFLQGLVVLLLHVFVPFGMCQQRVIAFLLDALQDGEQAHRWIEIGGFHQEVAFPFLQGQQVILFQTFLEEVVHHVFRRQSQLHRTIVTLFQFPELLSQGCGFIGDVLHDVRREPHLSDSLLFHRI